MQREQI